MKTVFCVFPLRRPCACLFGLLSLSSILGPSLFALPQGRFGPRQGSGGLQHKLKFLFGKNEIRNWIEKEALPKGKKNKTRNPSPKNRLSIKTNKKSGAPKELLPDALLLEQQFVSGRSSKDASFRKAGSIYGLTYKNGEYLYGQLQIQGSKERYRCKLWQKDGWLFLRIYGPYTWHTLVLEKL